MFINNNLKPHLVLHHNLNFKTYYKEIYSLIKRLYLQALRRPTIIITGIIQPLLWFILFGALFREVQINISSSSIYEQQYLNFLNAGIIVFTTFTGGLNAGLPLIFDREFGFLNRLLLSPVNSYYSLVISNLGFNIFITTIQSGLIMIFTCYYLKEKIFFYQIFAIIITLILLNTIISQISIFLAFLLPGHIEFLGFIILINLPSLFASTALAPMILMPNWLQIIACINPMTYAIEITRIIINHSSIIHSIQIMKTTWFDISLYNSIIVLINLNIINTFLSHNIIKHKYK